MADEKKRIIDLAELSQEVQEGQYILVDSAGGTGKMNLKKIADDSKEGLANEDGYYPNLYAGNLISDRKYTDSVPYLMRKTVGGASKIGEREDDTLVGASVGENQLLYPHTTYSNNGTNTEGLTLSVSGGYINITGTPTNNCSIDPYNPSDTAMPANHVCLIVCQGANGFTWSRSGFGNNTTGDCAINKHTSNWSGGVRIKLTAGTAYNIHARFMSVDLTQFLGSAIADYALTLGNNSLAWLRSYGFLTSGYVPYNSGSIESVEVTEKVCVGFNQWDEEWEVGDYNENTGAKYATTTTIRSKNRIKILPSTTYYFNVPYDVGSNGIRIFTYDADGNFVRYGRILANTFTTLSNAAYITFALSSTYGTTYNHDICINLSSDRNGEYEPYVSHTYDLGTDTLRGLFKLDSNNNLYADGDTKTSDGTVTRKYGAVDLGTLTYVASATTATNGRCVQTSEVVCKGVTSGIVPNMVSARYQATKGDSLYTGTVGIGTTPSGNIRIFDTAFLNLSNDQVKALLSGVYLVYELATPTTEQSTPFTSPQICDPDGTEEYVTSNGVPVGHETEYPYDLKGLAEGLIDVPEVPSANETYVLKATRTASGLSYNWVTG